MISTAKEFAELFSSSDYSQQNRVTHDEALEHTWFEILDLYPEFTIWVIRNKTVPLSVLKRLSNHPDTEVRRTVASKRKLNPELFDKLANDADEDVRIRIAYNKKAPRYILEKLSNDPSVRVAEVAKNRLDDQE